MISSPSILQPSSSSSSSSSSSILPPYASSSSSSLLSVHSTESQFNDSGAWSQILTQAIPKKSIPKKYILVLGKEDSGKSTLIKFLEFNATSTTLNSTSSNPSTFLEGLGKSKDLALSYSFSDLTNKDTYETQARIEFYQLSSPAQAFSSLLPWQEMDFLSNLYICIVLDWSEPFALHSYLLAWFKWIHTCLEPFLLEPWFQSLQTQLQSKFQLMANSNLPPSSMASVPLPEGMLTHNLGIPLSIVCTKSDRIATHLHEGKLTNDQLDSIQHTLRKEALSYGASLHSTSLSKPLTLQNVHTLLHRYLFSFHQEIGLQPNVVDLDELFVPHAWDSLPKLTLLSTTFPLHGPSLSTTSSTSPSSFSPIPSNSNSNSNSTSLTNTTTTTTTTPTTVYSVQAEPDASFLAKLMNQVPSIPTQDQNAVLANFFQSILAQSKMSST